MSIIPGYSSSEEEEEEEEDATNGEASRFAALPAPTNKRKGALHLPLLEEPKNITDDSSEESDEEEQQQPKEEALPTTVDSNNFSGISETTYSKRVRLADLLDEESVQEDTTTFSVLTSVAVPSLRAREGEEDGQLDRVESSSLKEKLKRERPEEYRAAARSASQFVEMSAGDIRAEARRYQQQGVTANLHKSKGVSGRMNQITNLARAAEKQRKDG